MNFNSPKMTECRKKTWCYGVHIFDLNVQLQYGVIFLIKLVISDS